MLSEYIYQYYKYKCNTNLFLYKCKSIDNSNTNKAYNEYSLSKCFDINVFTIVSMCFMAIGFLCGYIFALHRYMDTVNYKGGAGIDRRNKLLRHIRTKGHPVKLPRTF